jgi:protoheme IX farnesyltransferase
MSRTQNRPLPTGVLNVAEALILAGVTGILGIYLFINFINLNAALLAFASLVLYAFAYTPMKTVHPIAVFIGAIPGALPPMIGWVAATNDFGWEPGILFAIQFVWQFPHFWAIAWVLDEDYKKAGIRLLPGTGQDINTAFQIMIYTMLLIPLGFVPYLMGMTRITSAIIALVCGVLFLAQTFNLMKKCSRKAALQIMFGSFLYLPIVQIAFVLDKVEKL